MPCQRLFHCIYSVLCYVVMCLGKWCLFGSTWEFEAHWSDQLRIASLRPLEPGCVALNIYFFARRSAAVSRVAWRGARLSVCALRGGLGSARGTLFPLLTLGWRVIKLGLGSVLRLLERNVAAKQCLSSCPYDGFKFASRQSAQGISQADEYHYCRFWQSKRNFVVTLELTMN